MTYLSEDGEEGYPGTVLSTVRFKLTPDNKLEIGIRATTTDSTIVNISHGSLFNLAGHVIKHNMLYINLLELKSSLVEFKEKEKKNVLYNYKYMLLFLNQNGE